MPPRIDLVGRTFGRATVTGDGPRRGDGHRSVVCQCACGTEFTCDPRELRLGNTRSCGCLQREAVAKAARDKAIHSACQTPEYNAWVKIKGRCYNERDPKYAAYGGRGIGMWPAWRDNFPQFLADMGERPAGCTSLDRIDVNGNYERGNCRWADAKTQSRNKRNHRLVTVDGRQMPLSEACELLGVNYRSALYRLNAGKDWQPLPPSASTQGEG